MATTKKDLIERIARSTGETRTVIRAVVQQFLQEITAELAQGNRIEFRDFGVFATKTTRPRMAQNPKTLAKIKVPAKRRVVFKPSRLIKERLNGSRTRSNV